MQNDNSGKIINMGRSNIYSLLQHSQPTTASVKRNLSMLRKLLAKDRNLKVENVNSAEHDFAFQFSHLVIAELGAFM